MTSVDDYLDSLPEHDCFDFLYRKLYKVLDKYEDELKNPDQDIAVLKLGAKVCKTS